MSQHAFYSSMLRRRHQAAPTSPSAAESAKHLPENIDYYNVCGSF